MGLNVIITGASGMVGRGVLLECLENSNIDKVLMVNRLTINLKHPKLTELILPNFFDINTIANDLRGYNACFFCLGVSSAGMNERDYSQITYDLTITFAQAMLAFNPDSTFIYVSGAGTDSTEKGLSMWARVKGKTENKLLGLNFKNAYMFRPGFIQPVRNEQSRTKLYNNIYRLLKPLLPILKRLFPSVVPTTANVGKAMINVTVYGFTKPILESNDINFAANL